MNMCQAGDGKWIAMGLIRPHQWEQLISILDWPELVNDPRFETLAGRADTLRS
jgi:crotonobetainyl-CoA:carnitine CoA-transferase CaiB-like acyl-CoA transferase